MKFPSLAKQSKWERLFYCLEGNGDMAAQLVAALGWHLVVAVLGTITELNFTWLWSPGAASAAQREC